MSIRLTLCAAVVVLLSGSVVHSARAVTAVGVHQSMVADTGACPPVAPEAIKTGKKIFTGSGNCYTCHGTDAKGTPLAPDLTDKKWLQVKGGYEEIVELIHKGVPKPKEHPAPMPPLGGAKLSDAQVCAVGAYVFSLTHPAPAVIEK